MKKLFQRMCIVLISYIGERLRDQSRENLLLKIAKKHSLQSLIKSFSGDKSFKEIIFIGLLRSEIKKFVIRESDPEAISAFPRCLGIGDTLSFIDFINLKAKQLKRRIRLLTPHVFPCNVYYKFILLPEEYCFWDHPLYFYIANELDKNTLEFGKVENNTKIQWDLIILNLIESEQNKRNWAYQVYESYNENNDEFLKENHKKNK